MLSPRPLLAAGRDPGAIGVDLELACGQERKAGVERDDRLGAAGDQRVVGAAPATAWPLRRHASGLRYLVFAGPFIQGLGRHVEAVGPGDGAALRIEECLGEEGGVGEWLGDAPPPPAGEGGGADEGVL